VANIPPFSATNTATIIHAQHWWVLYDDGDTEDMDRVQVKAALGLAKKLRDNGKVTYDWNERDLQHGVLRLRTNTVRTEHRTLYNSANVRTTPIKTLRFSKD